MEEIMEQRMSLKTKTVLAVCLFLLVFGSLAVWTAVTDVDLEISKILTKDALPKGKYFATADNFAGSFGLFFEAVGSSPIYMMITLAATIMFWFVLRLENGKDTLNKILAVVLAFGAFAGLFLYVSDIMKYLGDAANTEFTDHLYVKAMSASVAALMTACLLFAWKNVKPENNKQLAKMSAVIVCCVFCYLLVSLIKTPVGRARFRAMNYLYNGDDFSLFTRWIKANGARDLLTEAQGVAVHDSCKSFPSGHTYSAATVYVLLGLPHLFPFWNKKLPKTLLWVCTIGYTALVAISRIMVGAHYFSDVLFGGTFCFIFAIVFREIFVCKGSHFYAVFPKLKKAKAE